MTDDNGMRTGGEGPPDAIWAVVWLLTVIIAALTIIVVHLT